MFVIELLFPDGTARLVGPMSFDQEVEFRERFSKFCAMKTRVMISHSDFINQITKAIKNED